MATAAVTLVSTLAAGAQNRKARQQEKKRGKIQQTAANIRNAKRRRRNIAEARRARAATVAQAQSQGVSGGSSAQQASGSVITQAASANQFSRRLEGLDKAAFDFQSRANKFRSNAATIRALGNVTNEFLD